ncbi:MAG: hypothetical protein LBT40_00365 [Deltaproteobacteria bacterium]|nr:hypothetical protein [Deltaproteobacteria bacterium]
MPDLSTSGLIAKFRHLIKRVIIYEGIEAFEYKWLRSAEFYFRGVFHTRDSTSLNVLGVMRVFAARKYDHLSFLSCFVAVENFNTGLETTTARGNQVVYDVCLKYLNSFEPSDEEKLFTKSADDFYKEYY